VRDSSISRSSFVRVILNRGTILYNRTELDYRIRHPQRYCLLGLHVGGQSALALHGV
jgi:hypothetical protein